MLTASGDACKKVVSAGAARIASPCSVIQPSMRRAIQADVRTACLLIGPFQRVSPLYARPVLRATARLSRSLALRSKTTSPRY